jgi:hypothetical protein
VRIEILDEAEADLIEGFHFYEGQETGLGSYFLDSLGNLADRALHEHHKGRTQPLDPDQLCDRTQLAVFESASQFFRKPSESKLVRLSVYFRTIPIIQVSVSNQAITNSRFTQRRSIEAIGRSAF